MKKTLMLMLALLAVCALMTGCKGKDTQPDAGEVVIKINTDGQGAFDFTTDGNEPVIDMNKPITSSTAHVLKGTKVIILAAPQEGWKFVEWDKGDTFFSKEARITVQIYEDEEYVAVFEPANP